ncbi:MAG TPA: albusnodin family lasso peptide [Pseudonocardiaceae bacterium]|nr:albusnodin family lasso peptide [Pseudonocardiaceae bacterium]
MDASSGQNEPSALVESTELVVDMADVASLTLGEGGQGSESKRYEYN